MSTRPAGMGDQKAVTTKIQGKYDPGVEREVLGWISELTGNEIPSGAINVERSLKTGVILLQLAKALQENSSALPASCQGGDIAIPEHDDMTPPFKLMENIDTFLSWAEAYGVHKNSLFQTVDLFEGRNLPAVLGTLVVLGTEAQRNGFSGPVVGALPKPRDGRRRWTVDQLRAGEGMIPGTSGSNKFANQKGMTFGAVRHGGDCKVDGNVLAPVAEASGFLQQSADTGIYATQKGTRGMGGARLCSDPWTQVENASKESECLLTMQTGTNIFASQKGMTMGHIRSCSDRQKPDEGSQEGHGILAAQLGSNQYASQKGMSMGAIRHCSNKGKPEQATLEGQEFIPLQSGTNQYASQKGYVIGGNRLINHKMEHASKEGDGLIPLTSGTNQFASQKGYVIGASRDIKPHSSSRQDKQDLNSHGILTLQSGSNQFASQSGMAIGNFRDIAKGTKDMQESMAQESNSILSLQGGTNMFASQKGMSMGAPRTLLTGRDAGQHHMAPESEGFMTMQSGDHNFANQKGMKIGATRHIADYKVEPMQQSSQGIISLQSGSNRGASQKGMRPMGAVRHGGDMRIPTLLESYSDF